MVALAPILSRLLADRQRVHPHRGISHGFADGATLAGAAATWMRQVEPWSRSRRTTALGGTALARARSRGLGTLPDPRRERRRPRSWTPRHRTILSPIRWQGVVTVGVTVARPRRIAGQEDAPGRGSSVPTSRPPTSPNGGQAVGSLSAPYALGKDLLKTRPQRARTLGAPRTKTARPGCPARSRQVVPPFVSAPRGAAPGAQNRPPRGCCGHWR